MTDLNPTGDLVNSFEEDIIRVAGINGMADFTIFNGVKSRSAPQSVGGGKPTTFFLISNGTFYLKCESRKPASVGAKATDVHTKDAYAQSWEVLFFPDVSEYQFRNSDKTFLGVDAGSVVDVSGAPGNNNRWKLVVSGAGYKIQNGSKFLKIATDNIGIDLVDDAEMPTVWSFQISGTVPP